MEIWFSILSLLYFILAFAFLISWKKIKYYKKGQSLQLTKLSLIIPVRNESKNILKLLQDLNSQSYPFKNFEVIVVNDNSSDHTADIVKDFLNIANFSLQVLDLPSSYAQTSSKKKAIETGVGVSSGEIIITTDGDCRVGPEWLKTIEDFYIQSRFKLMAGGVTFLSEKSFFEELQTIEFGSLIGSGAASLHMGFPNMCNGANLAYEKQVFLEVNGFQGNENIPSGDDEFLMHKIFHLYPAKVLFLKSQEAIVKTEAKSTLTDFIQQRKRWASKWDHYSFLNIKFLALFIFVYNLSLLTCFILLFFNAYSPGIFMVQFLPKIFMEFVFLQSVLRTLNKKLNILAFLFLVLIYPFYIVLIGLISKAGGYEWKGRKVK